MALPQNISTGRKPPAKCGTPGRGFAVSLDERNNTAWTINAAGQPVRSTPRPTAKEIEVCAGCHARRQQFSADPAEVGKLFDAFRPSTARSGPLLSGRPAARRSL